MCGLVDFFFFFNDSSPPDIIASQIKTSTEIRNIQGYALDFLKINMAK